jgi:DNA-binding IclR family transcriptional regulator
VSLASIAMWPCRTDGLDKNIQPSENLFMISHDAPSRSAERTLRLFESFAATGKPQTLSGLARSIDVPVSTCHGLVKTLQGLGYIYALGGSSKLYPTKKIFGIGEQIAQSDPVVEMFAEAMTKLRDASGETVILGVQQRDAVVYLDVRESTSVIRYAAQPGDLKALYSSAIGKLTLGEMEEDVRRETIDRLTLTKVTDFTLVERDALWANLEEGRKAGLYVTRGESVAEVMAMAAPVRITGSVFGLALAGPIDRMTRNADRMRDLLLETTATIDGLTSI